MEESSSVQDTSVHSNLLAIKPNQNLIIDLTPSAYEPYMLQVVECLKYSPLVIALSQVEVVRMSCLSHIYSTAYYDKVAERLHFDIHNEKTSISKNRFCSLLGLTHESTMVNPDSITTGQLFSMFYNKGCTETLTTVTKFKKSCLPPQWNGLFTLLFKGLSERSTKFDGASKSFMTMLYGLYNGVHLDYGSILWQQLVQSLSSSTRHSEVSYGRFWSLVSKWAMDRPHVPIMADSLLSSIAMFHTTKILVTDPSKYLFVGSIPASMYACVSDQSAIIQEYKKLPSSGLRELTPTMIRQVIKGAKGQTPKKQKTKKAAPSQPKKKKTKKPAQRLILQSSSDSDSDYVPIGHKRPSPTASESDSSDEEVSVRGDTPPCSPTPEVPVRSKAPSPPPASIPISISTTFPVITSHPSSTIPIPTPIFVDATTSTTTGVQTNVSNTGVHSSPPETPFTTKHPSPTRSTETNTVLGGENLEFDSTYFSPYRVQSDDDDDAPITKRHLKVVTDKLDQLLSSSSANPYSEAALKALFSSTVKEHDTSISNATKAIDASTSQCQKASLAVEASTKYCKEATAKVDKLISEAQIFLDSLQATAQKNAHTVTDLVDSLKSSLKAELSQLGVVRKAIEAATEELGTKVDERLTTL
ncbi:hypothetical protein Lser_V15G21253 [Lactuca serriola]